MLKLTSLLSCIKWEIQGIARKQLNKEYMYFARMYDCEEFFRDLVCLEIRVHFCSEHDSQNQHRKLYR